jgi:hypothetical protein
MTAAMLLATLWTGQSVAAIFKSKVVCNVNGDLVTGGDGDGRKGVAKITELGTLKFEMKDLPPNTAFSCELICTGNSLPPTVTSLEAFVSDCGTTNASGKADFQVKNFVDPAILCRGPVIKLSSVEGDCETGFGSGSDFSSE